MLPPEAMTPWLETAIDLSARRGSLLTSNLANVETPGYVPTDLEFEEHLRAELRHRSHFGPLPGEPMSQERHDVAPRVDGNQVDLDQEMSRSLANGLFRDTATEVLNRNFSMLRYAIDEGGR